MSQCPFSSWAGWFAGLNRLKPLTQDPAYLVLTKLFS